MYNKDCKSCQFVVYVAPALALVFIAFAIAKWFNEPASWVSFGFGMLIGYPYCVWSGKRMPMLHEKIK